jgi:MFS transporter, ACS family, aldohexuronate transporter
MAGDGRSWLAVYRRPKEHTKCSAAELEYIRSDRERDSEVPWARLLGYRQTRAFLMANFLTDAVW